MTTTRLSNVFLDRGPILKKIPLPLSFFGIVVACSECITFIISFLLLFGFMAIFGRAVSPAVWKLPFLLLLLQLTSYSAGMILGAFSLFLRDIREAVPVFFNAFFWLTPIIYRVDILPEPLRSWESFNPLSVLVDQFHAAILPEETANNGALLGFVPVLIVVLVLAQILLRRLERHIRDVM